MFDITFTKKLHSRSRAQQCTHTRTQAQRFSEVIAAIEVHVMLVAKNTCEYIKPVVKHFFPYVQVTVNIILLLLSSCLFYVNSFGAVAHFLYFFKFS